MSNRYFLVILLAISCLSTSIAQTNSPGNTLNFLQSLSDSTNRTPKPNGTLVRSPLFKTSKATSKEDRDLTLPGNKDISFRWSTNQLFSQATLNRYIAKQTVHYLSGTEDVSYYDNYFTANTTDGAVSFGRTSTCKDDSERVKSVLNYGLTTTTLNKLGNLFNDHQFSHQVGIYSNYTLFARGRIWYYSPAADTMHLERDYILQTIAIEQKQEVDLFDAKQADALRIYTERIKERPTFQQDLELFNASQLRDRNTFYTALDKKYRDRYFEMEESAGKPRVNFLRTNWWTTHGAISGVTDSVTPDSITEVANRLFYGVKAGINYSVFAEDFRPGWNRLRSLITLSAGVENTNQLRLLARYGAESAAKLGGKSTTKDGLTSWQGPYDNWWLLNLQARALLTLPKVSNVVSLDLFASTTTGRFASQDVGFGFLFTLPSQDKVTSINTELLVKFVDVSRKLLPGKDIFDRMQVGISVALPLNSNLNKL